LDETPGIYLRLRQEVVQTRGVLEQTRRDLAAAAAGAEQLSQAMARQQSENDSFKEMMTDTMKRLESSSDPSRCYPCE
jgi:hypothetical protein